LLGKLAVFSTAPIQATNTATAAAIITSKAKATKPANIHESAPDLIPTTSGPRTMNTSFARATAPATTSNTTPPANPIKLPKNHRTTIDLDISTTTSDLHVAPTAEP
jgi:hypothetical protein